MAAIEVLLKNIDWEPRTAFEQVTEVSTPTPEAVKENQ